MGFESAKAQLERHGLATRIRICEAPTPTVETAAAALGCEPGNIAKTLAFLVNGKAVLIVAAGDARIDNRKFKETFHAKASMIAHDAVEDYTGHPMGGVCPFGVKPDCKVYLDESLKHWKKIFPACGTRHSAVELTLEELVESAEAAGWVNVTKDPVPSL